MSDWHCVSDRIESVLSEYLGFGDRTVICVEEGEAVLPDLGGTIDLALLDAWSGKQHAEPAYNGKGIYALLIEAAYDKLAEQALLITHNDYLPDVGANSIAEPFLKDGARELARFHAFCDGHFQRRRVIATPDGFGVYLK